MMKLKRAALARVAASGLVLGSMLIAGPACAGTLLDLTNIPDQSGTPYSFFYTPSTDLTQISFAGYNLPNGTYANDIFFGSGATNLIQNTWTFTPAPSGSFALQDGVNLTFAGVTEGSYDTFSQDISTIAGTSYNLRFNVASGGGGYGNGLRVAASSANGGPGAPAPEVGMGLLSALVAGLGLALTRMRGNPLAGLLNRRRTALA